MQTFVKTCIHPISVLILVSISVVVFSMVGSMQRVSMIIGSDNSEAQTGELEVRGIGVIGDSMSDEYGADDARWISASSPAYNWVELLARERGLNFGEWGAYSEPRRNGYAYNWARSSATAQSMIDTGQHVGLADQVNNGDVNVAFIFIGANDFAPYAGDGYPAIYNNGLSDTQLQDKTDGIIQNIAIAVDTLQQAGDVHIILVKIPDWGNHISVQESFPHPNKRDRVSKVILSTNNMIEELANRENISTADLNMFYENLFTDNETMIEVNGVTFSRNTTTGSPKNVFLEDDVHLGTVFNGLLANYFVEILNSEYNADITPLTHNEIFTVAGIQE